MDGWIDGWMDEQLDKWTDSCIINNSNGHNFFLFLQNDTLDEMTKDEKVIILLIIILINYFVTNIRIL